MYEVEIRIGASASNYWALLEFDDKKGVHHRKEIKKERDASTQKNTLQAVIDALQVLKSPCMLNIYSTEDCFVAALQNGWITSWQQHSWKNAKGNTVRNVEEWKKIWELLAPHSRRVMKEEKHEKK